MYVLLLILSDWSYLILRLVFGGLLLAFGLDKFKQTKLLGILDIAAGFFFIAGFLVNWVALVILVEMALFIARKIYLGKKSKEDLALDILFLAVSLYFFTRGAGFWSLDENWLMLI